MRRLRYGAVHSALAFGFVGAAFAFSVASALAFGFVGAAFAFSVALATATSRMDAPAQVAPRSVGSNLHFSNPFLPAGVSSLFPSGGNVSPDPAGYDLGDATAGSSLVRFLSALDGVTPYTFSSSTAGALGLTVGTNGRVTGALNGTFATPVSFLAQVVDTAGVTRTGLFFLQTNNPTVLHFAQNQLPQARVGQDYNTNLQVIGGDTTNTVFSVASGSVSINGQTASGLETEGLTLFPDGTLAGRPLVSGTVTFTAQAIRNGTHALNRALTGPDQTYTIQVLALNSIQSVLATNKLTVLAGRPGRDSLSFSAFVNCNGQSTSSFAGRQLIIHFGNQTFSQTLDSFGQSRNRNFNVRFSAVLGTLQVKLRNLDLSKLFTGNLTNGTVVLQVLFADGFLGAETIGLSIRARNGLVRGQYTLGRNIQLGGLFQITGVSAGDFSGDTAFKIKFLLSHVRGNTSLDFGTATQATVNIGQGFSQTVPLFNGRGHFGGNGVHTINLNLNRKFGTITTFPLPASQTGVQSATLGKVQTLLLGLNMQTTTLNFLGEGSSQLIPFTFSGSGHHH
jgi:hypothetical protein